MHKSACAGIEILNLVGVSLRVVEGSAYAEARDAISHDWVRLLGRYDVLPLLLPNVLSNLSEMLDQVHVSALLLTNGNNVGPVGDSECEISIEDTSVERDATEKEIIDFAIENRVPLLGVCRGMQMINSYFGGRIVRDLAETSGSSDAHVAASHQIELVDPDYQKRLGTTTVSTNSFHRQAITIPTLSSQLRPFAISRDGVVEGLYHSELPIVGIQWHPERANSASAIDRYLIESWLGKTSSGCT